MKDSVIEWEISTHFDYDLSSLAWVNAMAFVRFDGKWLRKMFKIMKMIGISLKFSVREFMLKVL